MKLMPGAHNAENIAMAIEDLVNSYTFDKNKAKWKLKDRFIQPIEDIIGFKIGEYKNYNLI